MKKLKLLMDDLQVETFETASAAGNGHGTVRALQQTTWYPTINPAEPQCAPPSNHLLDATCVDSCDGGGNCTNVCGVRGPWFVRRETARQAPSPATPSTSALDPGRLPCIARARGRWCGGSLFVDEPG